MRITGGLIHEYMVCKRAAWYSIRRVSFENELVLLGKFLHEKSYKGEVKNVFSDNISLDFVREEDGKVRVYEVKKSTKMIEAARMQLAFYLSWLEERGVEAEGIIAVPAEKYKESLTLTDDLREQLKRLTEEMEIVLNSTRPPKRKWRNICKKCSYLDLCWA